MPLVQKRAGELLELLKKGDRDAFDARVRKYEGIPRRDLLARPDDAVHEGDVGQREDAVLVMPD